MAMPAIKKISLVEAAEAAASELVSVRHWGDASFINLPLIYPGGGFVTVKIDQAPSGFRVSDNGFAYREIESIGAQRSFAKTAESIIEQEGLQADKRAVFVEVPPEQISRAICDVAMASWQIADGIYGRVSEQEEREIEEHLSERLISVFGKLSVETGEKIQGSSLNEWEVSAIVKTPQRVAVFHAVSNHMNAIFKTSTAFHDLAGLEKPPALVSVVKSKPALGKKLGLLSQAGHVIEDGQPDEAYQRAAA